MIPSSVIGTAFIPSFYSTVVSVFGGEVYFLEATNG